MTVRSTSGTNSADACSGWAAGLSAVPRAGWHSVRAVPTERVEHFPTYSGPFPAIFLFVMQDTCQSAASEACVCVCVCACPCGR